MKAHIYYLVYLVLLRLYDVTAAALYWLELRLYDPRDYEIEEETEQLSNPVHIPRTGKGLH
jgi:hypothetical protein